MIILINGRMSFECVRPMTNGCDNIPTANKVYHTNVQFSFALQLLMHSTANLKYFITPKPLEKNYFSLYDQY